MRNEIEYVIVDLINKVYYSLDRLCFVKEPTKAFCFPNEELAEIILELWIEDLHLPQEHRIKAREFFKIIQLNSFSSNYGE